MSQGAASARSNPHTAAAEKLYACRFLGPKTLFVKVLESVQEGYDFSRAVKFSKISRALAPGDRQLPPWRAI